MPPPWDSARPSRNVTRIPECNITKWRVRRVAGPSYAMSAPRESSRESSKSPDVKTGRRVLVVDDDASIRRLLVTFLRRRGFELLEARNGREALEVMRAGGADLVLMDLMMPEVSGWDVLRERATDPLLELIPVIVVTAANSRDTRAALRGQNVCAVLAKPFDLEVLFKTVTTYIEQPPASDS